MVGLYLIMCVHTLNILFSQQEIVVALRALAQLNLTTNEKNQYSELNFSGTVAWILMYVYHGIL